ncbi:hypothetical protein PoB_002763900 [Plakobranchus ocellatus]|uniref:Uncharacterized protein n=1 Tax=Plakobranchus ocellatus TaxID=259542 RepID=A0AAV4A3D5_9GAST|nr:hypothetical protein PoB_002763900 [Plakobranchus ocellatus]
MLQAHEEGNVASFQSLIGKLRRTRSPALSQCRFCIHFSPSLSTGAVTMQVLYTPLPPFLPGSVDGTVGTEATLGHAVSLQLRGRVRTHFRRTAQARAFIL